MALEELSQAVSTFTALISQNILLIMVVLIILSLVFSKRRRTLVMSIVIFLALYLSAVFLNLSGSYFIEVIEIAVPFSITMLFFASETFYFFLVVSIILALAAPSAQLIGAAVSIGIMTPFFGETITNKIEELGWMVNE